MGLELIEGSCFIAFCVLSADIFRSSSRCDRERLGMRGLAEGGDEWFANEETSH